MGFFSDIVDETRRGMAQTPDQQTSAPPAAHEDPEPEHGPAAVPETPPAEAVQGALPDPAPAAPSPEIPTAAAEPAQGSTASLRQPEQQAGPLTVDLSTAADEADEAERRRAHENAEAERKAEFDARQAAKKAALQEQLDRLSAMSDADIVAASVDRVAADTERLTRRSMKEAVAENIQAKCRADAAFARLVMAPEKNMANCFKYINRKAREYAEQEMKDLGIERTGTYGCDVPDGLCYQWAEDYFNDPEAREDHKDDEKFVPRAYVPKHKTSKAKTAKTKSDKKKPAPKKPEDGVSGQMSLF